MIQVYFTNGESVRVALKCRDLLCTSWDGVDYRWAFKPIAERINVDVELIERWRVI